MKLKDLFKKVENANDFCKSIGEDGYILYISIDSYREESFLTYKEFERYLKEEWVEYFWRVILEQEIKFDGGRYIDITFSVLDRFATTPREHTLSIHICNNY